MEIEYMKQMVEGMKRELKDLEREQTAVVRQFISLRLSLESKIVIFEDQIRREENESKESDKEIIMVHVHS